MEKAYTNAVARRQSDPVGDFESMQNVQKFVMVPFDKYKRLTAENPVESGPEVKVSDAEEDKAGKGQMQEEKPPVAPPPGLPEKSSVRWLTLPEVE